MEVTYSVNESILNTIKKMLGIADDYTPFDQDIIVLINGAIMILRQLGVGPQTGFSISNAEATWGDYLGTDEILLASVKPYIYLKTKVVFDPPTSSFVLDAMQKQIDEYEWRSNIEVDPGGKRE